LKVTKTLLITTTGVLAVTVTFPTRGYTGLAVRLSAKWSGEVGGPLNGDTEGVISWGDGTSDTIAMPIENTYYSQTHTYSTTGTKEWSVVVTDPISGAKGTSSASILIATPLNVASFTVAPSSGPIPLAVTFTIGTISGGFTPYSWTLDYGDGSTPGSGTVAGTKTHTYTKVGTFTAKLTVTDALGASTFSKVLLYAGVLNWWARFNAWWNSLAGWQKALLLTGSAGAIIGGASALKKG